MFSLLFLELSLLKKPDSKTQAQQRFSENRYYFQSGGIFMDKGVQFDLTISGDKGVHASSCFNLLWIGFFSLFLVPFSCALFVAVDQPSSSSSCLGFTTL